MLRDLGDKFVTHDELMTITASERSDGTIELTCEHFAFHQGNYFDFKKEGHEGFSNWPDRKTAMENAVQDFKERSAKVRV